MWQDGGEPKGLEVRVPNPGSVSKELYELGTHRAPTLHDSRSTITVTFNVNGTTGVSFP